VHRGTRGCFPRGDSGEKEKEMLWAILAALVILWLLGFSFHIAGGLIHILLVAAVIILIINLWRGRDSGL
jgi:hypothetical protein